MLLKHNITLLFIFTLILLPSCKDKENILVQKQIERAIAIGEEQPQEARSILDSIQNPEVLSEKNLMLYQIADVKASRNLNETIREDQTKSIVKAATFFEKQSDSKNALLANYYAARAYHSQYSLESNIDQELAHYLKAYSYAESLNDSLMMGKALYNMGLMYAEENVFDSTIVYLKKACSLLEDYPQTQVQVYRLLSLNYYLRNDFDSAFLYLNKGIPLLEYKDNQKYTYLYNTLYGNIYKSQGEYKKAIDYLSKNMTDSIPEKEKVRTSLNLIEIYTSIYDLDSAAYYLKEAEPKLKNIQENELLLFGYMVLQEYYSEIGDKVKAKKYFDLFRQRQDTINKENEAETLYLVNKEAKIQQLEKAKDQYQKELYLLILFVVCVVGISVYVLRRIKKSKDKLINLQEKEIEDLRAEIKRRSKKKD